MPLAPRILRNRYYVLAMHLRRKILWLKRWLMMEFRFKKKRELVD
jgi:hypothetical protein